MFKITPLILDWLNRVEEREREREGEERGEREERERREREKRERSKRKRVLKKANCHILSFVLER